MLGEVRYYAVAAAAIVSLPNINPLIQIENGANWVDLVVGSQALASITPNNLDSCVKFNQLATGRVGRSRCICRSRLPRFLLKHVSDAAGEQTFREVCLCSTARLHSVH